MKKISCASDPPGPPGAERRENASVAFNLLSKERCSLVVLRVGAWAKHDSVVAGELHDLQWGVCQDAVVVCVIDQCSGR